MAHRLFKARSLAEKESMLKDEIVRGTTRTLSLVDASSLVVTGNLNLTLYALKVIPRHLYPVLLAASLRRGLVVSTKAIIGSWPFASLNFPALHNYSDIPSIQQADEQHDHPALAAAIAISEQKDCRIKDIDLTSLNISDRTNDLFLNTLLKGRQAETQETKCEKQHRRASSREHKELRILMNSRVTGQGIKAFFKKRSQLQAVNIRVRNKRLWVDQCGTELVERVLTFVDKEGTTELNLSYNSLRNEGLRRILPFIQQFPALTGLCLQYNTLNLTKDHDNSVVTNLSSTLQHLPHLRYLNLTANRITRKLAEILRLMEQPLILLDVTCCMLSKEDIAYLAGSCHGQGLQHLLLRDNYDFGRNWDAAERLLRNVADNLVELDLEHCNLGQIQGSAAQLAILAPRFKCLRSLEIQRNFLRARNQINVVVEYGNCPSMEMLRLSFPVQEDDVFVVEDEGRTDPEWFENVCRKRKAETRHHQSSSTDCKQINVFVYQEDFVSHSAETQFTFSI
nr:leucine-rich repeat-containing protein 14B-like [Lytechinus pictus]